MDFQNGSHSRQVQGLPDPQADRTHESGGDPTGTSTGAIDRSGLAGVLRLAGIIGQSVVAGVGHFHR